MQSNEKQLFKDREWLYQKAIIEDTPYAQIAKQFDVSEKTVGYWANKYGIKRIVTWQDINALHGKDMEKLYLEEDMSMEDICQKYNYAYKTVKKILKHRKVSFRSRSETVRIGAINRKKKFPLNEDYFEQWSNEMAYIVGFINADGNILYSEEQSQYVLQIGLQEDDVDILYKIKEALKYEGDLIFYESKRPNGKSTKVAKLQVHSKKLVSDLLEIGIETNKSLIKGVPKGLPEEYVFDYVRGYFDGNGTIDMRYERTVVPSLRVRLTSGSEKHLLELQELLLPHGFTRKKLYKTKGQHTYQLSLGNKEAHILHKKFYSDENSLFMQRKKTKFEECIQQRIKDQEHKQKNFKRERGKIQGKRKYA